MNFSIELNLIVLSYFTKLLMLRPMPKKEKAKKGKLILLMNLFILRTIWPTDQLGRSKLINHFRRRDPNNWKLSQESRRGKTRKILYFNFFIRFREKPGLVDSELDSQSKGRGFKSCLILHWMEMVSKPCQVN